ncbi:syntaxin-1A-like [Styela clava]
MIRDRMPDLLELARTNPDLYNEPELHQEVPLDPTLKVMFERAAKVAKFLSQMKKLMWELNKLHDRILTCSSFEQEEECRKLISNVGNRFGALARKSKAVLRRFEIDENIMQNYSAANHSPPIVDWKSNRDDVEMRSFKDNAHVTWHRLPSGNLLPLSSSHFIPAEIRMRFHLHNIFSYKLTCLVREYYVMQKVYGDQCRNKIKRQMAIIGREMKESELDEAIQHQERIPLLHQEILDDTVVDRQMQARIKEVEVLHKEILNLEKSIEELHKSFITISTLVHEQGAIVDRIEQHVSISADYVEDSTELLKKASTFQSKYRKNKCILAIIIASAIVILVIIIVVSVKKKQSSNTTKVVVMPPPYHALTKHDISSIDSDHLYGPIHVHPGVDKYHIPP